MFLSFPNGQPSDSGGTLLGILGASTLGLLDRPMRLFKEPSGLEMGFIVANYVACIPVLTAVGLFRQVDERNEQI